MKPCPNCGCTSYRYLDEKVHGKVTCSECVWGQVIGTPNPPPVSPRHRGVDVYVTDEQAGALRKFVAHVSTSGPERTVPENLETTVNAMVSLMAVISDAQSARDKRDERTDYR